MRKHTKIVATISDRKCDVDFIRELYKKGMNVVRLNTAHQTPDKTQKILDNVRKVSQKIPFLLDTKGPEIRTTEVENKIAVKKGDILTIKGNPACISTAKCVCVSYPDFVRDVPTGSNILIDDGEIELIVREKNEDKLLCEVMNEGFISTIR